MGYSIRLSDDGDHILLTVTGEIDGQSMIQCIVEAHALGKEKGISRYLVDATEARNVDSVLGNYEFAYSDLKKTKGVDTLARVAAVVSPKEHSHDFVETVLVNAGFRFKMFTDPEAAQGYLREK